MFMTKLQQVLLPLNNEPLFRQRNYAVRVFGIHKQWQVWRVFWMKINVFTWWQSNIDDGTTRGECQLLGFASSDTYKPMLHIVFRSLLRSFFSYAIDTNANSSNNKCFASVKEKKRRERERDKYPGYIFHSTHHCKWFDLYFEWKTVTYFFSVFRTELLMFAFIREHEQY